jgi:hypothetical protein
MFWYSFVVFLYFKEANDDLVGIKSGKLICLCALTNINERFRHHNHLLQAIGKNYHMNCQMKEQNKRNKL